MSKEVWMVIFACVFGLGIITGILIERRDQKVRDEYIKTSIYVDLDAEDGGIGTEEYPYNEFSDINWTGGGYKSVYDMVENNKNVNIKFRKSEPINEPIVIGASGTPEHPIFLDSWEKTPKQSTNEGEEEK